VILIDPKIGEHVDAAIKAGFTVYATQSDPRPTGWVAVCLEEDGPWAHIQQPTMALDPVELDVPVKPHKDWGSGVNLDHDGTPAHAVEVLRKACTEEMVTVRFMTKQYIAKHGVPKVPNWGRKCIGYWEDRIVKLGERGTNWQVRQLAGRLEVGDRFIAADGGEVLTVTARRYRGEMVSLSIQELGGALELSQRAFVTLLGAA